MYIALNSQTKVWKMEQFVVRNGFKAESIADLKGAKLIRRRGRPTSTPPRRSSPRTA